MIDLGTRSSALAAGQGAMLALILAIFALGLAACGDDGGDAADAGSTPAPSGGCLVTPAEDEDPGYEPGAPLRESVGTGYVLTGEVRSAEECGPLAGAMVELWLVNPEGIYDDAHRASVTADRRGRFRFQSNRPIAYLNQSPHIHLRVSAPGHASVFTIHRPEARATEGVSEVVLAAQ